MIGIKSLIKQILNKRYKQIHDYSYQAKINKYLGKKGIYKVSNKNNEQLIELMNLSHTDDPLLFGKIFYPIASSYKLNINDKINILLGRLSEILPKNSRTRYLLRPITKDLTKKINKVSGAGLSSSDFNNFPHHLISSDDLNKIGLKYVMNDDMDKFTYQTGPYIMNLDHNDGNGTHWVCIFIDFRDGVLCYMDPFGSELLNGVPTKSVKRYAEKKHLNIITNKYTIQHVKSNMCGYYAIYFAYIMQELYKREPITLKSMHKELKKYFSDEPSSKNVEKTMAFYKNIIDN
jgi:hypothetical protein